MPKKEIILTPDLCIKFFQDMYKEYGDLPIFLVMHDDEDTFTLSNMPSFLGDINVLKRQQYTVPSLN